MSVSVNCGSDIDLFLFQAEDGIRDLVRSRGLGDVYKRQALARSRRARGPLARGAGAVDQGVAPTAASPDLLRLSLIHI